MYKLKLSRREKRKLLKAKWLIVFLAVVCVGLIVWAAWIRPMQKEAGIKSFEECAAAGNPVQLSYPEVCLTKDGRRFVNLKQQADYNDGLEGTNELVPPSNPALLKLDIDEWGVRVPLTMKTFDLSYSYIEDGGEAKVLFTYKRFLKLDVCKGDIGLTLTRSFNKRQPPYTEQNPAPIAQVGKVYFYVAYAEKNCYDSKNPDQAALVKAIAGEQTLTQATTKLLSNLKSIPEE